MRDDADLWQQVERPAEGQAVCFELQTSITLSTGQPMKVSEQGFLVCFQGEFRAWINRCPHAGSPLDWSPGQFFSEDGKQLVCHTHFALFDPLSGDCLSGPCTRGLFQLEIRQINGEIEVPASIKQEGY